MENKDIIPITLKKIIDDISQFQGYGEKSAQRFTVNLLKMPRGEAIELIRTMNKMLETVHPCKECGLYTEKEICDICSDDKRNRSVICVVEESFDAFTIEKTQVFNGLYHILGGRLSPLEGITAEDLNIKKLLERIDRLNIKEVILATNPTVEGEATANYIHTLLKKKTVVVSRIAYGIPFGTVLENVDEYTLSKALENKIKL
ncbi:MAG: recombination protein RecR [Persephonella sp.]|nr:MAG: recombination protein RecR [Persephonella sp.]RUM61497.1 MAG: recombination protein RecR [Persephonella sp.]